MNTAYEGIASVARVLLSVLVLLICLFYTFAGIYLAPYPGFELLGDWLVAAIEPCDTGAAWCEANRDTLRVGDQVLAIGDLSHEDSISDLSSAPFAGYSAGDTVPITFLRDGQVQTVDWQLPGHTNASRLHLLLQSVPMYVPFWLIGTIALFLPRLRVRSRTVQWPPVAFNYITAIWIAVGAFADLRAAYSIIVEHSLAWLLVPVYLHFHLAIPSPLLQRRHRYLLVLLYSIAAILAILELLQVLPHTAFSLAILLSFVGSVCVLVFRLFRPRAADKPTAALMLTGICLSLGPAIVLWGIPTLLQIPLPLGLPMLAIRFAVPLLPLFYAYAIYKRRLGSLEYPLKRMLGLYGFMLAYVTTIIAILSIGGYWLVDSSSWLIFSGTVWTVLAVAALPLYTQFQRLTERLAYGTVYSPNEIIHRLATRIPAVLDHKDWTRTLADELASSLLIHQSALHLLADGGSCLVYARGIEPSDTPVTYQQIQPLLADAGRYRPPSADVQDGPDWVRLAIPLEIRGRAIGIWLFGQRDPDDYYPKNDVNLLTMLASQVAVAVENNRLYDQALQEIAERKCVEEALRDSEERMRLVVQNMPVMLDALDADGNFLVWNRECEQVTGYSADEIIGNPNALELLYPGADYLQCVLKEWDERGNDFRDWELELTAKDGSTKTVMWFNISERFPIPDWATWAIGVDVTEHRQAERELRIKDTAIASSIGAIAIADLDGDLVYVNRSFLEYWGYDDANQVLERPAVEFWESQEKAEEMMAALRRGEGWVGELVAKREDGSSFDVELAASVVKDEGGRPTCIMGSFLDVTQRKRAEQQAMRAERLAAMGQMAIALAHEVNNPLQTVRSNLELLLAFELDPDEHKQRLDIALKEIERLAGITRRVLDFVQPPTDTMHAVSITELVHRSLALMDEQLGLAHIRVTADLPADPLQVRATPSQIVQVLSNLIANTIEALPDGGHLHITGYLNGDSVTLDLSNDGPHLTPEQAEHIFDPFFTTKLGRTGLGLFTSRIIAEQHGGKMSARNLEGEQGVVFTIALPAVPTPTEQETSE
jgi:two-component system, sporulation sensor kinase E